LAKTLAKSGLDCIKTDALILLRRAVPKLPTTTVDKLETEGEDGEGDGDEGEAEIDISERVRRGGRSGRGSRT